MLSKKQRYGAVMRQDFPKDFADEEPFTSALLDSVDSGDGLWRKSEKTNKNDIRKDGTKNYKGGKKNMSVTVMNSKGKTKILLNPSEKASKFADELRQNCHYTNDNRIKGDKNGDASLTKEQRAYRSGYLDARKDSAKAYKYNKSKNKVK